jgi:hypothetical protein
MKRADFETGVGRDSDRDRGGHDWNALEGVR